MESGRKCILEGYYRKMVFSSKLLMIKSHTLGAEHLHFSVFSGREIWILGRKNVVLIGGIFHKCKFGIWLFMSLVVGKLMVCLIVEKIFSFLEKIFTKKENLKTCLV